MGGSRMTHAALPLLLLLACSVLLCASGPAAAYPTQLTPGAEDIESHFPVNSASASAALLSVAPGYPHRSLSPLRASVNTVSSELVARAGAAFRAEEDNFQIQQVQRATNALVANDFFAGGYDFAVLTHGPSHAHYRTLPTLTHLPLMANAIVFTYQLASEVTSGVGLALDGLTLCRIHTGNITTWDDPAITSTNPAMAWRQAAGKNITLLLLSTGSATHLAFSTFCSKVDPDFGLAPSDLPPYSSTLNARYFDDIDAMNSAVYDTPLCLCVSTLSNIAELSLPVGALMNARGVPILPTSNAMSLALFELATDGFPEGQTSYDLTRTGTPQAWPIMTMAYLYLDTKGAVSTCANKRMMLKFFQYFFTSEVVRSIADSLSMAALPAVLVSQLKLQERLTRELTCLDTQLISDSTTRGVVAVDALVLPVMTLFGNFYRSIDTTMTLNSGTVFEQLAVQRVVMGENSLAVLNAAALTDDDVALLKEGLSKLIPAFLVGVVPIFHLPDELLAFAALESTADLGLPPLYPIKIDMEVTTHLFLGGVTSWLHPVLTSLNPQLTAWFTASGAPTTLHLLVGATAANDALSGAKLLWHHLQYSQAAKENAWAFVPRDATTGPLSNPFLLVSARLAADADRANMTMIERESRLNLKLQTMSGAVSYRILSDVSDITSEFQFVDLPKAGMAQADRALVPSNLSSLRKCGGRLTNPPGLADMSADEVLNHMTRMSSADTQRTWIDAMNREEGCWPLASMLSYAAKLGYSTVAGSTSCTQGLHALEFINFIQTSPVLSGPAETLGLVRLAENDLVKRLSVRMLQAATCDDQTLMVVLPTFWTVGASIRSFAQATGGICLAVLLVSIVLVVTYRQKVVIRSSSTPFLVVILVGMALLVSACIAWGMEASRASCSAFLWLANTGFMTLFCPLFAKTWRVWRIFSGAHLRIVKISNQKLLLGTAVVIFADLILIAVWQGVAPLIPIEYDRVISSEQHVFTHCSVRSSGSGLVFVGLVAAEKAGLLLFGAVMAFSTRNVKGTFNESSAISWSIYNTLLSLIIGVVIIVFVGAVEDTLMVLVLILLLWIVCTAWGLIFVPKFHMLMQSDEKMIEQSRSEIAQEKSNGFSFASIAMMTAGQVKAYYQSLKLQVNKAERVLQLPVTNWRSATAAAGSSQWTAPDDSTGDSRSSFDKSHIGAGPTPRDNGRQTSAFTYDMSTYAADKTPVGRDPESVRERGVLAIAHAPPAPVRSPTHSMGAGAGGGGGGGGGVGATVALRRGRNGSSASAAASPQYNPISPKQQLQPRTLSIHTQGHAMNTQQQPSPLTPHQPTSGRQAPLSVSARTPESPAATGAAASAAAAHAGRLSLS